MLKDIDQFMRVYLYYRYIGSEIIMSASHSVIVGRYAVTIACYSFTVIIIVGDGYSTEAKTDR